MKAGRRRVSGVPNVERHAYRASLAASRHAYGYAVRGALSLELKASLRTISSIMSTSKAFWTEFRPSRPRSIAWGHGLIRIIAQAPSCVRLRAVVDVWFRLRQCVQTS